MKRQVTVRLIGNRAMSPGWHHLIFAGEELPAIAPGQFVEVAVPGNEVLLNRPISVFYADSNIIELIVAPVGRGTEALCRAMPGQQVRMIMPLGRGFAADTIAPGAKVLLVGGGVGIAPLYMQLEALRSRNIDAEVVFGLRTAPDAELCRRFESLAPLHVCTDDGSAGHHGLVTAHPAFRNRYDMIQMCGPRPMMRAVAAHALSHGIDAEASLENMMACGIGACLCCVEPTAGGNLCVCKEGPVFNIKQLTWK